MGRLRWLVMMLCVGAPLVGQQFSPSLYQEMRWRMIGPFRAGRTVAATGIPGKQNVFYMAVNNGGAWKSTDFGHTWNPIFDGQPTGSIGALAVAPSNPDIIYIGSGEGLHRPDLATGDGIYKSTDGGKTWQHLGLRDGQQIPVVLVDPHDPNRVFAAVLGHPYGPNPERGVFRSTDGGKTWQKILYKDENTGAIELAFDPKNSQTLYACLWSARRPPWTTGNTFDGPGSGMFKSIDGGNTWQPLTQGLPTWADGLGRIGIGIAPSNPSRMYALVDANPDKGGLYRSDNAGQTWTRVNNENRLWGRGSDFAEVKVDPRNPDEVYVANICSYRSMDGGKNFTAIKGAPGGDDYHRIWINPENPDIILMGVDQGATLTVNGGATWSSWYNQPTAQFYHVITDNQFPYWVYGGQQESGSIGTASRSDYGEITFRDWHTVGTEEYGYVAPDPLNPNIIYGGKVSRYDQTTTQVQDVSPVVLRTGKYRFNRTAPLIFSPVDKHALFLGSNVLFKTTNGGQSWQIVSPDLTRDHPGVPPNLGNYAAGEKTEHRGVIYSIGPSFKDANLIWVGSDDGLIHVTRDGGKTWQNVTPPELTPWSKVAQIEAGHFDTNTCYAAVNRFRLDDLHAYIYRTHDGGETWQKITTGLPDDASVNAVREDPERKGLLFAGTETNIWVSFDDGDHWQSLQLNLPATSMRDLVVHGDDIVVGTHGRSFWILDDITPLRQISAEVAQAQAHLFRPQVAYRVRRSTNTDTPLPPEEPAGQNPPDGAVINYTLKAESGPVTLEIFNPAGTLVRRYTSTDKPEEINPKALNIPTYWVRLPRVLLTSPGMHRWAWNLHYPPPAVLRRQYPISAIAQDTPLWPQGPRALPGEYTVKLTVGGQTFSQPLTVKMDPRVTTPASGLQQQFEMEMKIADALQQDYDALQQVRAMRQQLKELASRAPSLPGSVAADIAALEKNLSALEGAAGGFGRRASSESFAALNDSLATVYEMVDSADAPPTSQAATTLRELQQALATLLLKWTEVKTRDVLALNQQLRGANLGEIGVP
ncbi:MAG: glycoside hydrolase [Acidobacteriia bacterium]|nr:glycoside hydrolase [Terriglobia bacterium]